MVAHCAEKAADWVRAILREYCATVACEGTVGSSLNFSLWFTCLPVSVQAALRESPLPVGWKTAAQSALRLRLRSKTGQSGGIAAILDTMCAAGSVGPGLLAPVGWRRSVQRLGLRLSARQCDELFEMVDTNNDGAIDLHELLAWTNAEQGMTPIVKTERSQISSASVTQECATQQVAAAVATIVRQQFGGSAETAFLYLLEVTPRALNQPETSHYTQDDAHSEDSESLSEIDFGLDGHSWAQQHKQQQKQEEEQEEQNREAMLATSFTLRGFLAAMQRLFMLSAQGTVPTTAEAEALFFRSTGMQADTPGILRLPEFRRLCALGSSIGGNDTPLKEELQPPAAVEYIGRHSESVLACLEKAAMNARQNNNHGASGLEDTLGQAAEGYATMAQLREVLSKPQPAGTRRHRHRLGESTFGLATTDGGGRSNARPRLALTEQEWSELELLADPRSTGVLDCEAFVRYGQQTAASSSCY